MKIRKLSINNKLMLVNTGLVLVVMLIVSLVAYSYMRSSSIERTKNYEQLLLEQVISNVDDELEQIDLHSYGILTNVSLQRTLEFPDVDLFQKLEYGEMQTTLVNSLFSRNDIASIYVFDNYGNVYGTNDLRLYSDEERAQMTLAAKESKGKMVYLDSNEIGLVKAARLINNQLLMPVGTLIINIRRSTFQDIITQGDENIHGQIVILDGSSRVVAASDEHLLNIQLGDDPLGYIENYKDTKLVISQSESNYNNWQYITYIEEEKILNSLINIKWFFIFLGIGVFIVFSVISYYIAKYISRPIMKFTRYVHETNVEEWHPVMIEHSNKEVIELNAVFNNMMKRIKDLIEQVYKEEIVIEKQKFESLQAQVNPHFLYNTLDFINWTARKHNVTDVSTIVGNLSSILRYSLQSGDDEVSLYEEMEFTKKYIQIQKHRFGEKLDVIIDIDDRLYDQGIFRMSLQPLVENAFKHGFCDNEQQYRLSITSVINENSFDIIVSDNGIGLDEAKINQINASLQDYKNSSQIGLANLNERIRMRCGSEYGIELAKNDPKGLIVKLTLPLV